MAIKLQKRFVAFMILVAAVGLSSRGRSKAADDHRHDTPAGFWLIQDPLSWHFMPSDGPVAYYGLAPSISGTIQFMPN